MILEHDLLTNPRTARMFGNLPRTERIVDVGCGIRPCPAFPCDEHICIEPHGEYREHLARWKPDGRTVTIVDGMADAVAQQPRDGTTVLLLDVIEHMDRTDGERIRNLLTEFEHAVIFTPLGWYEQNGDNPDVWGMNGGDWQKHRSAWQPEDFHDWRVRTWSRWHRPTRTGAILAIR